MKVFEKRKLQSAAKFHRSINGNIHLSEILSTGLFNFETASKSAEWVKVLEAHVHTPKRKSMESAPSFIEVRSHFILTGSIAGWKRCQ
jgi:G3E family GTPase